MKTAGIVVLFNSNEKKLKKIQEYYTLLDYFFVIDNSEKNNYKLIKPYIPSLIEDINDNMDYCSSHIYIPFCENKGLCYALNKGIEKARILNCEWVLILDDDSSFITNIINVYTNYIKNNNMENIAILAPVHLHDRTDVTGYIGTQEIKRTMLSGCLFNTRIFYTLNGFKEELFVDGLDMDYCYRMREKGYRILQFGEAIIKHFPSETKHFKILHKIIFKYGYASPWRYQLQGRSLIWMILRYRHMYDVLVLGWKWIKVMLFFDNKGEYIKCMIRGMEEGLYLYKEYKKQ